MNILIIDDMLVFEKVRADLPKNTVFARLASENYCRRLFLAREFSALGANVLLARLEPNRSDFEKPFEYRERDGISQVLIPVRKNKKRKLFIKELFDFCSALSDNAKSLSGLFMPDVVVSAGVLPFCSAAAAKIAECANAVLITELSCSPAELLKRLGLVFGLNPVLALLKRSVNNAFLKSDAVVGLFPDAHSLFKNEKGLYSMNSPGFYVDFSLSDEVKQKKEKLLAFGGGNTFVLACRCPLENGFSLFELINVCSGFGNKFALVFLTEGYLKNDLKKYISEKGITNVFFMDTVLPEEMPFVLSGADAVFLSENSLTKGLAAESGIFFSAFGSGKPVIASSEHYSFLFRKSKGTVITKPRNKDSLKLGIKTVMDMSEADRDILGLSNKSFYEQNSKKNFALDYYSLMDNLVKQKEIKQ